MKNVFRYMALCTVSVLLFASTANAKTPDGLTPSVETVCDNLTGAAFGLCNAYCEALDCGDPNQAASDTACDRVNDNFEKKTGMRLPEPDWDTPNSCVIEPDEQ